MAIPPCSFQGRQRCGAAPSIAARFPTVAVLALPQLLDWGRREFGKPPDQHQHQYDHGCDYTYGADEAIAMLFPERLKPVALPVPPTVAPPTARPIVTHAISTDLRESPSSQ